MDHARFARRQARDVVDVRHGRDALEAMSRRGLLGRRRDLRGCTSPRCASPTSSAVTPSRRRSASQRQRPWAARSTDSGTPRSTRPPTSSAVEQVRDRIAAGSVYQVNVCRVLSHAARVTLLTSTGSTLFSDKGTRRRMPLASGARRPRSTSCPPPRSSTSRARGGRLVSSPIKGTAPTAAQMLPKDRAENVMIVDLVRNDLSAVCRPGTVRVDRLCDLEPHPGLVHLVSSVSGELRDGARLARGVRRVLPAGLGVRARRSRARSPPSPTSSPRRAGPTAAPSAGSTRDTGEAELAVGIRTFWAEHDAAGRRWLRFGTGAGITWASDPGRGVGRDRAQGRAARRTRGGHCDTMKPDERGGIADG